MSSASGRELPFTMRLWWSRPSYTKGGSDDLLCHHSGTLWEISVRRMAFGALPVTVWKAWKRRWLQREMRGRPDEVTGLRLLMLPPVVSWWLMRNCSWSQLLLDCTHYVNPMESILLRQSDGWLLIFAVPSLAVRDSILFLGIVSCECKHLTSLSNATDNFDFLFISIIIIKSERHDSIIVCWLQGCKLTYEAIEQTLIQSIWEGAWEQFSLQATSKNCEWLRGLHGQNFLFLVLFGQKVFFV